GRDQGPAEPPASGPTPGAWGPEAAQGPSYEGTQAMPALRDVPIGGTAPPAGGEGGYRPDDRYDQRYGDPYPEDGRDGGHDRRRGGRRRAGRAALRRCPGRFLR